MMKKEKNVGLPLPRRLLRKNQKVDEETYIKIDVHERWVASRHTLVPSLLTVKENNEMQYL
jgi:hypothetical protein